MAQKDYVSRGRSPKQNPRKKNQKNNQRKKGTKKPVISITLIVSAVVVILLLVAILVGLSHKKARKENAVTQQKTQAAKKNQLPEKPEERWQYIKELENRPVTQHDIKAANQGNKNHADQPKPVWVIQCGAFDNEADAEELRASLAFSGIESLVIDSSGWKKVILGPYAAKADTARPLQDLSDLGLTDCSALINKG